MSLSKKIKPALQGSNLQSYAKIETSPQMSCCERSQTRSFSHMPFTLGGDYIPPKKGPVRIKREKRGRNTVTLIYNLPLQHKELEKLASELKKKLGAGGAIKDGVIEIQGDKVEAVKKHLSNM